MYIFILKRKIISVKANDIVNTLYLACTIFHILNVSINIHVHVYVWH